MNTKFDLTEMSANIVYLKPMDTADLPDEVREQAGDMEQVFAVHNGQGEQVAYIADLTFAAHLADAHNMQIVTLH